jgi:hypothetical protein
MYSTDTKTILTNKAKRTWRKGTGSEIFCSLVTKWKWKRKGKEHTDEIAIGGTGDNICDKLDWHFPQAGASLFQHRCRSPGQRIEWSPMNRGESPHPFTLILCDNQNACNYSFHVIQETPVEDRSFEVFCRETVGADH